MTWGQFIHVLARARRELAVAQSQDKLPVQFQQAAI
jgi:hypothetical protein